MTVRASTVRLLLSTLFACAAQAASAEDAECTLLVGGNDIIRGPCEVSDIDAKGSFSIASPDREHAARIITKGGGVGEAYWNGTPFAEKADVLIGSVVLVGACWISDKTKLCVTR